MGRPRGSRIASRSLARWKVCVVPAIAALLAIGASSASGKGGSLDFGDAPDGVKAGYITKPAVVGHFPSKSASGGPRHAGLGSLRLGPTTDGEPDSHQVDKDIDDGASLSAPKACKKATLTAAIQGSAAVAAGKVVYVNAWFDWNRDGDWADPTDGCAPEWGVRNLPVAASSIGSVAMLPIKITAGKQVTELWYRVTITLDEVQIDPSGRGRSVPYLYGETEDYLHQGGSASPWIIEKPKPPPPPEEEETKKEKKEKEENKPFTVKCVPKVRVIAHGGTASFGFNIADKGKGLIFGEFLGGRKGKGFEIKIIPSPNQAGVPKGFKRVLGFLYKGKEVDPPTRVQTVKVKIGLKRGKVAGQVTCTVVIVHVGKGSNKKGGGKKGKDEGGHEHVKPPKIPAVKCEGGCGGALPVPPPTKGPTLTDYELRPDGSARIHVTPTDPLNGLTIPLFPPNPTGVDPPKVVAGNQPIECELKPLELTGGPAAVKCKLPTPAPPALDSFFDVFFQVSLDGVRPITGTLNAPDGTPVESFSASPASPTPVVSGTGTLAPGPNPNAVDFKVKFDAQNTALQQFVIFVPPSLQLASGGAGGFSCSVVKYEGFSNRALACNGPVTSGQEIQGGFELTTPRPSQLSAGTKLLGSPGDGTLYGPFDLAQMPVQPSGTGVFSPPTVNTYDFSVNLNSFGALNQFLFDFPAGVQVTIGSVTSPPAALNCSVVATSEPSNGLKCEGPISSGQQYDGSFTLTSTPPGLGANSQLFASGPATPQFGPPFTTITDAP